MNSLVQRTFQLDQQNEEGDGESMGGSLSYFYLITKEVTSGWIKEQRQGLPKTRHTYCQAPPGTECTFPWVSENL